MQASSTLVGLFGLGVLERVSGGYFWELGFVGWLVDFLLGCFIFLPYSFRMKRSKLLGAVLEAGNRYSLVYF